MTPARMVPVYEIPGHPGHLLLNVRPIDPVPAKGRQGLWEWEANDA